jgi:hypothetical protein
MKTPALVKAAVAPAVVVTAAVVAATEAVIPKITIVEQQKKSVMTKTAGYGKITFVSKIQIM